MDMMDMDSCPMVMYFHFSMNDCVLIREWKPIHAGPYFLTLIVLFIMCFARELLLYIGKWYEFKTLFPHKYAKLNKFWITRNDVHKIQTHLAEIPDVNTKETALTIESPSRAGQFWYDAAYPLHLRLIDGLTFGLSLLLGYWTMLVTMTYNAGYFITICLGFVSSRVVFYGQNKNLQMCLSLTMDDNSHNSPSQSCH